MTDTYAQLVNTPIGALHRQATSACPQPVELDRFDARRSRLINGRVLFGAAPGGRGSAGRSPRCSQGGGRRASTAASTSDVRGGRGRRVDRRRGLQPRRRRATQRYKALVFDATGIAVERRARASCWAFFHPTIRAARAVAAG